MTIQEIEFDINESDAPRIGSIISASVDGQNSSQMRVIEISYYPQSAHGEYDNCRVKAVLAGVTCE